MMINKAILKTLKIGQDVTVEDSLYRVYDINRKVVYLVPIANKLIMGFIATVPDMTRKPLMIERNSI